MDVVRVHISLKHRNYDIKLIAATCLKTPQSMSNQRSKPIIFCMTQTRGLAIIANVGYTGRTGQKIEEFML